MVEIQPKRGKYLALKATKKKGRSSSKHRSSELNSMAESDDDTSSNDGDIYENEDEMAFLSKKIQRMLKK